MPLSLVIMWEGQECKEGFLRLSLEIYSQRFDGPNAFKNIRHLWFHPTDTSKGNNHICANTLGLHP